MEVGGGLLYFIHLVNVILLIVVVCLEADVLAKRLPFHRRVWLRRAFLLFNQDVFLLLGKPALICGLMAVLLVVWLLSVEGFLSGKGPDETGMQIVGFLRGKLVDGPALIVDFLVW